MSTQSGVALLDQLLATASNALQREEISAYEALSRTIGEMDDHARELFQRQYAAEYAALASKLERGQPLTAAELQHLRLLIVGDAQAYLQHENNFEDWQAEIKRIADELAILRASGLGDGEALLKTQALCRDARNVIPDILNYLRERERLQRFDTVTAGQMDASTARFFATMIREMLATSDM